MNNINHPINDGSLLQKRAKNAVRVQSFLDRVMLECDVLELSTSARTALDASIAIGCSACKIVKSLIFKIKESNEPVLGLVSGTNQVDVKILENSFSYYK